MPRSAGPKHESSRYDPPGLNFMNSDSGPPADSGGEAPTSKRQDPSPSADSAAPASFEAALAELEQIVAGMETGELTLEQSLSAYKRGAGLLQYCQAALKDAQQQVKVLEAGVLQDFAGADDDS